MLRRTRRAPPSSTAGCSVRRPHSATTQLRVQLEHVAESSRKACAETLQTLEESHEDAVFTSFWQSVLRERINPSAASSPPQQQRAHLPAQGACRGGMYGKR